MPGPVVQWSCACCDNEASSTENIPPRSYSSIYLDLQYRPANMRGSHQLIIGTRCWAGLGWSGPSRSPVTQRSYWSSGFYLHLFLWLRHRHHTILVPAKTTDLQLLCRERGGAAAAAAATRSTYLWWIAHTSTVQLAGRPSSIRSFCKARGACL